MRSSWIGSLAVALLIIAVLAGCDGDRVYQNFTDFDSQFWHQDTVVTFRFKIEDAGRAYNLKTLFRNSQQYPYHNLYYQYTLADERDSVLSQELMQIFLFDPKTGVPLGGGVGEVYDTDQVVLENFMFPSTGEYEVSITQYMRLDTLPNVHSVGWRVENIKK